MVLLRQWKVPIDQHLFDPFRAPLAHPAEIIQSQRAWLDLLLEQPGEER